MAEGAREFSVHRAGGYGAVVGAVLLAVLVEGVAVHVLVGQWSPVGAWVLTGLGAYSAVWVLGDYHAMRHRPLRIEPDRLVIRLGLRWEATIGFESIEAVTPVRQAPPKKPGTLVATALGQPRYLVRLRRPVEARGPYGWRRRVTKIAFGVDDAERFEAAVREDFGAWRRGRLSVRTGGSS